MSSDPNASRPRRFPVTLSHLAPAGPPRRAAAQPAAAVPRGVGMDSAAVRARMVQRLRAQGCVDDGVLQALDQVPRHLFVDTALAPQAYEDTSLPIGLGQTISKPSVVARMLELLRAGRGGVPFKRVLEIGTGCGYQAAVLSLLARQVFSVERLRPLHDKARENLAPIRPAHLRLVYGDGRLGHPPNAPYDAIISAAGAEAVPAAWVDQLAPGGRLVAPALDATGVTQVLVVIDRFEDGRVARSLHESVRFVPLESGVD
jgi:protein-L-isoaspartate(D-aspartate) O-methyltransferase